MLAAAVLAPAAALAVTDAERVAVYREYRAAFDAHHYPDALPLAEKLVALTEEQYGANDRELVNPLANLAPPSTAWAITRMPKDTYLRSVKIAADTGGGSADRLLLRPLQGLGATYYATRQYEDASVTLQRRARSEPQSRRSAESRADAHPRSADRQPGESRAPQRGGS